MVNRALIGALVVTALIALGSAFLAFRLQGRVSAQATQLEAAQADLASLKGAVADLTQTGAKQATQRAELRTATQAAAAAVTKDYPDEVRPRASPAQLERLQRLRAASRAAAASAAVVP